MSVVKRFRFDAQEWEVLKTGPSLPASPGVMGGDFWPVTIRCVTEPSRAEIRGYMRDLDIEGITETTFATLLRNRERRPSSGPAA